MSYSSAIPLPSINPRAMVLKVWSMVSEILSEGLNNTDIFAFFTVSALHW